MIAIIGCGTLGSRVSELLAGEELLLVDHDVVLEPNLSIQKFMRKELGMAKAEALSSRLENSRVVVAFIDPTTLELLSEAETVCDCTDNLVTRRILNQWCLDNGVTLVHAAASERHGVVAALHGKPCLSCIYAGKVSVETCRGRDIPAALADSVAQKQSELAREAIEERARPEMHLIGEETRTVALPTGGCPVCRGERREEIGDFYMTWCPQAQCLSAKPVRREEWEPRIIDEGGIAARVLGDGEIRFTNTEDWDAAARVAKRVRRAQE